MEANEKNIIIIGNGPAGVSASLYTARAGIKTLILGKGQGSLAKAEKIENYYGLEAPLSGSELIERGLRQAERLGVEILRDEVVGIGFSEPETDNASAPTGFIVKTKEKEYPASAVIIATGTSRTAPPVKGLKELEGQGISYCAVCDAFFYRGRDVAVLGSSEYALHEVQELMAVAGSVTLLTNGEEPSAEFPDSVKIKKEKISSFNAGPANPLLGTPGPLASVTFESGEEMPVSGIFVAYGVAGSTALAKKVGAFTEGNKIITDENMSTNIKGLFAAGDCTGGLLQVAKAVADGASAGTSAVKYLRSLQE
ncbi:MAG: NAD(P)/FAD-dependent oxidoreductase [Anaerovoracaceae bacterium]